MTRALRQTLTPPMLVALLALAVALSGTAYAAGVLPRNSVGSAQLKSGAVKTSDLGAGAVTAAKIKNGSVTGSDLGPGSITAKSVKDGSLTRADLAAGVVRPQSVLPSGQSMSGTYAAVPSSGNTLEAAISFPGTLPVPIAPDHVVSILALSPTAECPGYGRAARGYLCIYRFNGSSSTDVSGTQTLPTGDGAGIYGVLVDFTAPSSAGYANGFWTVTAP